jgi:hypothetical protein
LNLYVAIVADEAQVPEFVHEVTHPRACYANHLRQHLLTEFSGNRLWPAFLAEIRKEKEEARKALLA